jgi:hypothetical protein
MISATKVKAAAAPVAAPIRTLPPMLMVRCILLYLSTLLLRRLDGRRIVHGYSIRSPNPTV